MNNQPDKKRDDAKLCEVVSTAIGTILENSDSDIFKTKCCSMLMAIDSNQAKIKLNMAFRQLIGLQERTMNSMNAGSVTKTEAKLIPKGTTTEMKSIVDDFEGFDKWN